MAGVGMRGRRTACVAREGGRRDGHCSRQYASYWNAFLFESNSMSCRRSELFNNY